MEEIAVGKLADIADGDYRIFAVEELEVGIFRNGSKVLAYENVCPHAGGPVCQGKIFHQVEEMITPDKKSAGLRFGKQRHIVCPWHGYEFDLATGCHPGDASVRLTPVPVAVRDGKIYVSVARYDDMICEKWKPVFRKDHALTTRSRAASHRKSFPPA